MSLRPLMIIWPSYNRNSAQYFAQILCALVEPTVQKPFMYVYSEQFKSGVLRDTGPIFVSVLT